MIPSFLGFLTFLGAFYRSRYDLSLEILAQAAVSGRAAPWIFFRPAHDSSAHRIALDIAYSSP